MSSDLEDFEPSLRNVIEQESLTWVFVGGKGGVGKTTCSASLASQLSLVRESVLVLSTDPAHNLSDAFSQKFSREPTLVNGYTNLYAMEIDPNPEIDEEAIGSTGIEQGFLTEIMTAIPGVDEAMSFAELMKQVQTMKFSVIVFDTAPTGHTLRLLQFPQILDKCLAKFMTLGDRFSGMFQQVQQMAAMMGMSQGQQIGSDEVMSKIASMKALIENVLEQFRDPNLTTFVCVCIPEFLSLYETERLVQELTKYDIDTHNIIVNQILIPEPDCNSGLLRNRTRMQQKYLSHMQALYGEDFHLIRLPLLDREVRGPDAIKRFSTMLLDSTIVEEQRHWAILPSEES